MKRIIFICLTVILAVILKGDGIMPTPAELLAIYASQNQLNSFAENNGFTLHLADGSIHESNGIVSTLIKDLQAGEITKIKLIGDSITEGTGAFGHTTPPASTQPIIFNDGAGTVYYEGDYTCPCWANYFRNFLSANFPAVDFVNAGIGGKTAVWTLANIQYLIGSDEDVVFVMLGANDKYNTTTLSTYKSTMEQLLAYIKARCNTMIVMTENPATDDYNDDGAVASCNYFTTADIDRTLTEICVENGYYHISLYREMFLYSREKGISITTLIEAAGPHPNDVGYEAMWLCIQNKLGFIDNQTRWKDAVFNDDFESGLIDGNFQIAQMNPVVGTEVTNPALYSYPVFDMWRITGYLAEGDSWPTNIKHSQRRITESGAKAGTVPGANFCYRINVDGAGSTANSAYIISQPIENGVTRLCSGDHVLPVSLWARSSISGKIIGVNANINYGTGGSPSSTTYTGGRALTLKSTWQKYSFSIPLPDLSDKVFGTNGDDSIDLNISLASDVQNFGGSGDIEIAMVRIREKSPKSFAEELRACQRYLEKSYEYSVKPGTAGALAGAENIIMPSNTIPADQPYGKISYKVRKRNLGLVDAYGAIGGGHYCVSAFTGADLAEGSGTTQSRGEDGFQLYNHSGGSITAISNCIQFQWVCDARF